jgi:hypothetical protein
MKKSLLIFLLITTASTAMAHNFECDIDSYSSLGKSESAFLKTAEKLFLTVQLPTPMEHDCREPGKPYLALYAKYKNRPDLVQLNECQNEVITMNSKCMKIQTSNDHDQPEFTLEIEKGSGRLVSKHDRTETVHLVCRKWSE